MAGKTVQPITAAVAAGMLTEALEDYRLQIVIAKEKRSDILYRAVSRAEAEHRVDEWCARIARDMTERVDMMRFTAPTYVAPPISEAQPMALAAIADLIRQDLLRRVAEIYKAGTGIDEAERIRQVAETDQAILSLELAEEAIIRSAEAKGLNILRRANADPRAVLASDEMLP